jgi:hypothetical protein
METEIKKTMKTIKTIKNNKNNKNNKNKKKFLICQFFFSIDNIYNIQWQKVDIDKEEELRVKNIVKVQL